MDWSYSRVVLVHGLSEGSLLVVVGQHPDDPGQVLAALGFALVAAGVEVARQGRHTKGEVSDVCDQGEGEGGEEKGEGGGGGEKE